ncbi:hypothetical protein NQD34_018357 [Periophthalmus magnuspinnatus]|nr:hypothetical protein NQD34_018357 [Periophthalmus magnuspinnatus]
MSNSRFMDLVLNDLSFMPLGRQLPITIPSLDSDRQLDCKSERPRQPVESRDEEAQDPNNTSDLKTLPVKQGRSDDPESMLNGKNGPRIVPVNQEFMQRLKENDPQTLQLLHSKDDRQRSLTVLEMTAPSLDSSIDTKALLAKL